MEILTVPAKKRDAVGSRASVLVRREGYIPAVLYGHGGENIALALPRKTMEECLRKHVRLLSLDLGGDSEKAMVKEIQWDSMGDEIEHIDLIRVRMDEVISMVVSIEAKGRAKGVDEGGILEKQRTEVQIKCLPGQIPESIVVDVSNLGIQQSIHVRDLPLPEGVELDDDPDLLVFSIVSRVEIEEGAAPAEGETEGGEAGGEQKEKKEDES